MQIEQRRVTLDRLAVMDNAELGALVRSKRVGKVNGFVFVHFISLHGLSELSSCL